MLPRIAFPNLLIVVECHSCTPLSLTRYLLYPFHASNAVGTCLNPADLSAEIEGFYFNMLQSVLWVFKCQFFKFISKHSTQIWIQWVSHYEAKLFELPCVSSIFKCTLTNSHAMSEEMGETYINTATLRVISLEICAYLQFKKRKARTEVIWRGL